MTQNKPPRLPTVQENMGMPFTQKPAFRQPVIVQLDPEVEVYKKDPDKEKEKEKDG